MNIQPYCKKFFKSYQGFTLAEVLVTLAIIGIVAALTIPTLLNSVRNGQYESALKKEYSAISQAYKSLEADGISMTAAFPGASLTDDGAAALNILAPKLSILKNCGYGMGCWYDSKLLQLDGEVVQNTLDTSWNGSYGKAILSDGTLIAIQDYESNCTSNLGTGPLANSVCGWITIDVNGSKGPNVQGRDVFMLWATKTGIYPWGIYGDWAEGTCRTNSQGWGCASYVITQGMDY